MRENTLGDNDSSFSWRHRVSIGDTNITRSVYFPKWIEWLGYAREAMIVDTIGQKAIDAIKGEEFILVTQKTAIANLREYELYDMARLELTIAHYTYGSVRLCCRFFNDNTNELYGVAKQIILLVSKKGKPHRIPLWFSPLLAFRERDEEEIDRHIASRLLALGKSRIGNGT